MTRCRGQVAGQVLFLQPPSAPEEWVQTDLWESALRIPGVEVRIDFAGAEQRRFGARVSGEVCLYQPTGELAFHGGITAGRGHAGDNEGRAALESLLQQQRTTTKTTPVFGCDLESDASVWQRTEAHFREADS
ncbi:MAG: hypothetical protein AB7U20_23790 [Planctomycetaceae bacterium]